MQQNNQLNDSNRQAEFTTLTICAHCCQTNTLGLATISSMFAAGAHVPICTPGRGIGAIQGAFHRAYNVWIQDAANALSDAETILNVAVKQDHAPDDRQSIYVATNGTSAAFTGKRIQKNARHVINSSFALAGHGLPSNDIIDQAQETFALISSEGFQLSEQLLKTLEHVETSLEATHTPMRSAALFVTSEEPYPIFDLRVDDGQKPVHRLREIYDEYLIDDLTLDFAFATTDQPDGKMPAPFGEAARWLKRTTRRWNRRSI